MHSTSAPSDERSEAGADPVRVWHYDGESGLRHQPLFETEGDSFRLTERDRTWGPFAFADLVARDAVDGDAIFGLKSRPGWRIGFAGGVPADIAAHLPGAARYGGWIDRFGLWKSVAVCAALAAVTVTLVLRTPAAVARMVPPSVEQRLGDLMVGDLGNRACNGPGGVAALSAMLRRIDPGDRKIEVRVVHMPIVNAVTLPGGKIVIFDQLIEKAASPDEVAGVLAHEIGHVEHRDVMESLLRQLGLSVLLGGLDGNVGGYTNALLSATYSRGAEERADDFAREALGTAKVSPLPTAEFFRRLSGGDSGVRGAAKVTAYFSSHPMSSDRAARFTAAAKGRKDFTPALTPEEWANLRAICSSDPDRREGGFRF
jgi:hypothetical protein